MSELSVGINGNMDGLKKALTDSEKALQNFKNKADGITKSLERNAIFTSNLSQQTDALKLAFSNGTISQAKYQNSLLAIEKAELKVTNSSKQLSSDLRKVNSNARDLGGAGMSSLKKGAASGNSAMTAFSRTIQDAPFGIMGVSNNITNLTEQFGYLRNKTGSAGGALKAMLTDLKGFGGITLLISLVTSALLVFGDKLFPTRDRVKALRKEQENLTKSLDDYVFGLKEVDKATLEGSISAVKELTTLRLLKSQIENTTLSTNQRKGAIDELRKKYPEYLKDMTDEKMLNGGLTATYNLLTTSILKRARATAASDSIIENTKKLLVIEDQILQKQEESERVLLKIKAIGRVSASERGTVAKLYTKEKDLLEDITELQLNQQKLNKQNTKLETNISSLGGIVSEDSGVIDFSKIIPEKTTPEVREKVTALFESVYQDYNTGVQGFQDLILNRQVDFSSLGAQLQDKTIDWESYFNLKQLADQKLALDEQAMAINKSMDDLLVNNVSNSLSNLGEAIGSGTASATEAVMTGMGSLLSAMGDKLIQLGTAAVLAGTITSLFGSIAGIGAGLAAIAGGIALKAIGTGISGSFKGAGSDRGSVNSDTSKFSPSRGGSSSKSSDGGGFQNVVFQIEGTKLVGVLSNTLKQNRALGGSLGII